MMKPLTDYHKPLNDPAEWDKMPQILKDTPYFADGKILFDAIRTMMRKNHKVFVNNGMCDSNRSISDRHMIRYLQNAITAERVAGYAATDDLYKTDCVDLH